MTDACLPAGRLPVYTVATVASATSSLAGVAGGRPGSSSLHRAPASDPLADEADLDILVSRGKHRRGKN